MGFVISFATACFSAGFSFTSSTMALDLSTLAGFLSTTFSTATVWDFSSDFFLGISKVISFSDLFCSFSGSNSTRAISKGSVGIIASLKPFGTSINTFNVSFISAALEEVIISFVTAIYPNESILITPTFNNKSFRK